MISGKGCQTDLPYSNCIGTTCNHQNGIQLEWDLHYLKSFSGSMKNHLHVMLHAACLGSDALYGNLLEMRGLTGGKQKEWRVPRAEITQLQKKQKHSPKSGGEITS